MQLSTVKRIMWFLHQNRFLVLNPAELETLLLEMPVKQPNELYWLFDKYNHLVGVEHGGVYFLSNGQIFEEIPKGLRAVHIVFADVKNVDLTRVSDELE
jgi:hypothetical protein